MTDLFVSYKSEDRARVAPLVAALEADGLGVWWDAHIEGGSAWRDTIESELNAARCVLVVWSGRSAGSEGSFVRDEATRALRRGAYLPVRIDPVEPPLGFGETQALPLIGWKGDRADPQYLALLAAVQAVIAGKPRPVPAAYQPKRGIDRRLVLGGGAAVAIAAGMGGWWSLHRDSAPGDSVAVMPFANLSGDPSQAYFSDGIAEELRDALTRIASLKVAARTSSELMRDADVPTAAAKLGVANILTGTVRRGAGTLRINAELVDGKTGLTLWSQSYDRTIGDALAIEAGIAESVAGALKIALGHAQKALLSLGGTTNPVAQDAYLRGFELGRQGKMIAARKEFDAAVTADPGFALAHSVRAENTALLASGTLGGASLRDKLSEAEAEARLAIALAPGLGVPLARLGVVLQSRLDLRGAAAAFTAAYKATPGDAAVMRTKALFDAAVNGGDQSLALFRRGQALDPLRPAPLSLGKLLLPIGRIDDAINTLRSAALRSPGDPRILGYLAIGLLAKGQPAAAVKAVAPLDKDSVDRLLPEAIATTVDGAGADRALASLIRLYGGYAQYQIAEVYAQRRLPDLAFAAIEKAWALIDPGLLDFKTDPLLAPLRPDPRYGMWLRKIGFP